MTFGAGESTGAPRGGFLGMKSLDEEDLAPGMGFQFHAHEDIEILTYARRGTMIHQDEKGGTGLLRAGEFRCHRVLDGTRHRLMNRSFVDRAHIFHSCWASGQDRPDPPHEKRFFPLSERTGILRLIASQDGRKASLRISRNARIFSSLLEVGNHLIHELEPGRGAWLHVVDGRVRLVDDSLGPGDGAGVAGERAVSFTAQEGSEILLFDLA
jgi:hypothetical protein